MTVSQPMQLPSMPGTVIKLLQMFSDPDVCIEDVVDTIKTDAALCGRILKAANSSSVAASREVSDLKRAATLLGRKTVSTLALSFSLADRSMETDDYGDLFRTFWNQSIICGVAASRLAKKYRSLRQDEAFLVGLLCRIGRLGALSFAPEQFGACSEVSARSGCCIDTMSLNTMGMNCEELTLEYMRAWKLPPSFVRLVEGMQQAGCRDRQRAPTAVNVAVNDVLDASTILRAAAAIGEFMTGENSGIALATIHELLSPVCSDPDQEIEDLFSEVMEEFVNYGELLDVDTNSLGTPAELHARAMSHLTEIAMAPERDLPSSQDQSTGEVDWLKHRVDELARKLTLDPMTSIHNRSYFDMKLEQRISVARLVNRFVAVLFVDVNEFKKVNDTHGHDVGDEVICAVAHALQDVIRREDLVARYGGDEFVILCEMNDANGLQVQAQRITDAMAGLTVECRGLRLEISLAIGGAIGAADGRREFAAQLLRVSDEAMYEAKQNRSNPVTRRIDSVEHCPERPHSVADEAVVTGAAEHCSS